MGETSGTGVHGGPDRLVLYPSWVGLLSITLVPSALVLLGLYWTGSNGSGPLATGMIAFGVLAALYGARTFPRHVVVSADGIERRCLLRRHHLAFDELAAIERAPGSYLASGRRMVSSDPQERKKVVGGLVASGKGRRRWMLTDQPESRDEYDRLAELLLTNGGPELLARRPQAGAAPTSLYRRRPPS